MPKGSKGKSSASAGTRKKHAKKAAKGDENPSTNPRGGNTKKKDKKAPKIKQYIPPPKPPAPAIPDPLDSQGLARTLPAELVVVLRRLGKKDGVTKRKGLEDLREWISEVRRTPNDPEDEVELEIKQAALVSAVPVWLHNLSGLLQSPSHRILTLQLHQDLLSIEDVRAGIIDSLSLSLLPGDQVRNVLGSWLVAAVEEKRRAGGASLICWDESVTLKSEENRLDLQPHLSSIIEYLSLSIKDPSSLNDSIYPTTVTTDQSREATPGPDESEDERTAWYRVGGLQGLAWLLQAVESPQALEELLKDEQLWSCLSSRSGALGSGQPTVRRSAYALLEIIVTSYPELLNSFDNILAKEMLTDCWLETEAVVWEIAAPTSLKVLTGHRQIWDKVDDDSDSEDSSEDEPSPIIDNFLRFISTICPAIPHHTYPLLLVVISTMPSDLLPIDEVSSELTTLFSHLWSPLDARLLSTHSLPGQQSALQVFLQSALDCTILLIAKAAKMEDCTDTISWLGDQLVERAWKQGVLAYGGRSRRGEAVETEAEMFGRCLARLHNIRPELADQVMSRILDVLILAVQEPDSKILARSVSILEALQATCPSSKIDATLGALACNCGERLDEPTSEVMETLSRLYADHSDRIPITLTKSVLGMVSSMIALPDQLVKLLSAISITHRAEVEQATVGLLQDHSRDQSTRFTLMSGFQDSNLVPSEAYDELSEEAVQAALAGDSQAMSILVRCMENDSLSPESLQLVLALCSTSIHDMTDTLLHSSSAAISTSALSIFCTYANSHLPQVIQSEILRPTLIDIFHLVNTMPQDLPTVVTQTWNAMSAMKEENVDQAILAALEDLVQDLKCQVEPSDLVDIATMQFGTPAAWHKLVDLTKLREDLEIQMDMEPVWSLAILDPLVSFIDVENLTEASYDAAGRSSVVRRGEALLRFIRLDRSLASDTLDMVMSMKILCEDGLSIPGASKDLCSSTDSMRDIVQEAEATLTYSMMEIRPTPSWHKDTCAMLVEGIGLKNIDVVQKTLLSAAKSLKSGSHGRPGSEDFARVFRDTLSRFLKHDDANAEDAELWLALAPKLDPLLGMAITLAVKPLLLESKAMTTYQNRLANNLLGIRKEQVAEQGMMSIRQLTASAPPEDAAAEFIPQQRALFVLRHIGEWVELDDLPEEYGFRAAELCTTLAPIVQDLPGAHWDLIYSLIEQGLDVELRDDPEICGLYQSLVLLRQVRDLCANNKSLRATWDSATHYQLVLRLFVQCRDAPSVPLQRIQNLLLDLVQGIDQGVIEKEGVSISQLCDLLHLSSNWAIQATAYRLLIQVIKRNTLALVLDMEATINDEDKRTPELPEQLVRNVALGTALDWHSEVKISEVISLLLSWMAIMDHFDDSSRSIRLAYIDQLRSSHLVELSLLPMLFEILGVSETGAWNFPASQFEVDEFYPELLEPEELPDLAPLASHLFYRTLSTMPSTIRAYYESLKDRQLSLSLLNFTARHFSPVIIQHEFAALRQPATLAELTAEGLTVKIAQGGGSTIAAGSGSAEATASYVVDEQPMEIGIRLPAEFPLKGVDVRDLRRAGVPENKWRGWLMNVQQTMTSRNGLIVDALTIFKRNVSLHFEGVVECSICYSIISLTDRTLPTKPCKTCKNRFHASCLFKWFNSSHSSSCPMCRALF